MEIKDISGIVLFALEGAKTIADVVLAAVNARKSLDGANLYGANLYGASLDGASLDGKKVDSMRVFNGMYRHTVYAVLFQDGQRWIRMGCLWMSLDEWEKIGIRNSNLTEYPDDGSDKCEERVAAFEFAKNTVLRMKLRSTYDRP